MKQHFCFAIILMLLLSISFVSAAPVGSEVNVIESYIGTESSSEQINISVGNVTETNITGLFMSLKWAGFLGNITGGIKLADASDNRLYEWVISNLTGVKVYAANNTVTDWASLSAADSTNMPGFLLGGGTENYTNTFTDNESQTFNGDLINAKYTGTYNLSGADIFKTYSLKTTNAIVWATFAINNEIGFQGDIIDYQLIVPAQEIIKTVYNFYLELS